MARKMTREEQSAFHDAIAGMRMAAVAEEENLFGNLDLKRHAAMALSAELGAWFNTDWPARWRS